MTMDDTSPTTPAHASTHVIDMRAGSVIKRFRSWSRNEHHREWTALTLLAEHAPDLAPAPLEAHLADVPPTVAMSRLRGTPMGAAAVTSAQLRALALALDALHRAIPRRILVDLPPRIGAPGNLVAQIRSRCAAHPVVGADPVVRRALLAAGSWLDGQPFDDPVGPDVEPVLGVADGNLANYLWDGARVRLVDFENSGRSDRAFELADLAEHPSAWLGGTVTIESLLAHLTLTDAEVARLRQARRLCAYLWLLLLLPAGPAHHRNPPGTHRRQAERLLRLLH